MKLMEPHVTFRYLDRAAIVRCGGLDMLTAIRDVEEVLRLQEDGHTVMPLEVPLRWSVESSAASEPDPCRRDHFPSDEAGIYALPAYVGGDSPAVGIKWTTHLPDAAQGLPRVIGLIVLNDAQSGQPIAVLESALIGAVRTAAASALAIRCLGWQDARTAAIIGAGLQARIHLHMLAQTMPGLHTVLVANRTRGRADGLLAGLAHLLPWPTRIVDSPEAAFHSSDIVVTCTAASQPFVHAGWIRPGLLAITVGPFEFTFESIDAFARVVVDKWGEFKHTSLKGLFQMYRAGRFRESDVWADLADLLLGRKGVAHTDSVFVSLFGLSLFDIAVARRIVRNAERMGEGQILSLFGQGEEGRS